MKYFNIRLLITLLALLFVPAAFATQETVTRKVEEIQIDYRGWFRITPSSNSNSQGCSGQTFTLYDQSSDAIRSAMLAVLLAAKANNKDVDFLLSGCHSGTDDPLVWIVTIKE